MFNAECKTSKFTTMTQDKGLSEQEKHDKAKEVKEHTKHGIDDTIQGIKGFTAGIAEKASEGLHYVGHQIKEGTLHVKESLGHKLESTGHQAKEQAKESKADVRQKGQGAQEEDEVLLGTKETVPRKSQNPKTDEQQTSVASPTGQVEPGSQM